jgi:hypothetical protein
LIKDQPTLAVGPLQSVGIRITSIDVTQISDLQRHIAFTFLMIQTPALD